MTKELTDLQKAFFIGQGAGQTLFTQKEFDQELEIAKAEIMAFAIDSARQAVMMEREACARIVDKAVEEEEEGELSTALKNVAESIRKRIPSQILQ